MQGLTLQYIFHKSPFFINHSHTFNSFTVFWVPLNQFKWGFLICYISNLKLKIILLGAFQMVIISTKVKLVLYKTELRSVRIFVSLSGAFIVLCLLCTAQKCRLYAFRPRCPLLRWKE